MTRGMQMVRTANAPEDGLAGSAVEIVRCIACGMAFRYGTLSASGSSRNATTQPARSGPLRSGARIVVRSDV